MDPDVTEQIIEEFHGLPLTRRRARARGGRELAEGLLEASFGSEQGRRRHEPPHVNMAGKSFEFLEDIEPVQILALIDGELPQTIALVLAHLQPAQGLRRDVRAARLAARRRRPQHRHHGHPARPRRSGSSPTPSNSAAAPPWSQQASKAVGGIQPLLEIINRTDAGTERSVLDGLDQLDPDLAVEIGPRW